MFYLCLLVIPLSKRMVHFLGTALLLTQDRLMALHSEFHLPYPNLHLTINTVPDSVAIGVITDREIKLFASILYCMQTYNLHKNFLKQDRHFSSTKDTKSQKVFLPTKLSTTVLNQPTHSQDLERKHLDILGKRSDFQIHTTSRDSDLSVLKRTEVIVGRTETRLTCSSLITSTLSSRTIPTSYWTVQLALFSAQLQLSCWERC